MVLLFEKERQGKGEDPRYPFPDEAIGTIYLD
jgi:hypothetical protein